MSDAQITQEKFVELAEYLKGTCHTLEEGLDMCGIDHVHHEYIENHLTEDGGIFLCDGCGWYCEEDELNNLTDKSLCNDCHKDNAESMAADEKAFGRVEDEIDEEDDDEDE